MKLLGNARSLALAPSKRLLRSERLTIFSTIEIGAQILTRCLFRSPENDYTYGRYLHVDILTERERTYRLS